MHRALATSVSALLLGLGPAVAAAEPGGVAVQLDDDSLDDSLVEAVRGVLMEAGYRLRPNDPDYELLGAVAATECTRKECRVTLSWQLRDARSGAVVYDIDTSGSTRGESDIRDLHPAVRASTHVLLSRPLFQEAVELTPLQEAAPSWTEDLQVRRCDAAPRLLPDDLGTVAASVVQVQGESRQFSGVLVSPDGWVVTTAGAVGESAQATVVTEGGQRSVGQVARVDVPRDLAILRVPGSGYPCLPATGAASVGEPVFALGRSTSHAETSTTWGTVVALHPIESDAFLRTDASLQPDHTGGPLLDSDAAVVGIVSFEPLGLEGVGVPASLIESRLGVRWSDRSATSIGAPARRDYVAPSTRFDQAPGKPPPRKSVFVGAGMSVVGLATGAGTALLYSRMDTATAGEWTALQASNTAGWGLAVTGAVVTTVGVLRGPKKLEVTL